MSEMSYDRKIHCLATLRDGQSTCPQDETGKTTGQESGSEGQKPVAGQGKARRSRKKKKPPLSEYLYETHDKELFAKYSVPASTLGVICYTEVGKKKEGIFVLVDDYSEQDSLHGVFWTEREISRVIIDTIAKRRREIKYRDFRYFINWYTGPKLKARIIARHEGYRKLRRIEENTGDLVDVQIYLYKRPCIGHPDMTEMLTVNVFGIRTPEAHPISVYYCPVCNEYYVNYDEYQRFCRRYGIPPFRLYDDRNFFGSGGGYYDNLREQSKLNLYGYNVSESNGLTAAGRQNRLAEIIDAGLMKQAEICSLIEGIMRMHKNSPNCMIAMKKWEQDLAFVQAYKRDTSRVVWGRFVPGRGKKLLPPLGE